ncbi:MAG: insulinase family protein [Pseudomonadales bacterium]|nr:insulinase family protein [Pseudomonadales bacterium]
MSPLRRLLYCFVCCVLVARAGAAELAPVDGIAKSPRDTREYREITLDNDLRVLLISDPATEKAAASVDVQAGSNADPAAFPGLAHFLEHMLFLGTDQYPNSGEYQEFISSNGGSHNAYTAYENTNYYFDIDKDELEPALARFSRFFVAPLFTPDYVDRERNAVNSEYQSGLQDDGRRAYSALKEVLNPAHPLARFSVGSLDTLSDHDGVTLRQALLDHYDRYYSANLMSAAILGGETLDELEALARRYFSAVPNHERAAPVSREPLFNPGSLPAQLSIEPVRDSRSLSFTFVIPDMRPYYRGKPLDYLSNLLGHEGEGSLLSLLRERGWANGLSAGGGFGYHDASTFGVNVALTAEGLQHVDDISALLFQYIDLVREQGIHEWMYDELSVMANLSFEYQDPASPINYVSSLSSRLREYPANELLSAPYVYADFDTARINEVLAALRPDNLLITLSARGVDADQVDPWYGERYAFKPLDTQRLASWTEAPRAEELTLPVPNPFIPQNLAIKPMLGEPQAAGVPSAAAKPQLLVDEGGARLWFKQDQEFLVPRATFNVYALTPLFNQDLRNSLLASFVVSLVNDQLNEYSYPANLAGVYFGLSGRARGFTLTTGGYDDKQPELLEALLSTLTRAEFERERFDIIKAEMIRGWRNAELQTPYVRLFQQTQALLTQPYWSEEERIAAAQDISFEDVSAFVPRMLSGLRLEAMYHGNVQPDDARAMLEIVQRYLKPDPAAPLPDFGTVVKLEPMQRVVLELELPHDDSAIVIYQQAPDDSLQSRATLNLLATLISTPFFDTLRTEQQLGYIVNASTLPILDVSGLVYYIESPVADPLLLEERIDAFLNDYTATLDALPQATFDSTKAGLLTSLRQPPRRLEALSSRYWSDILIEEYEQDSTLAMANAVEALTLDDLRAYYHEHIVAPNAGRLVARSAGRGALEAYRAELNEAPGTVVLDEGPAEYAAFKASAEQYEFGK